MILIATYWIMSPDVVKERFISAAADYKTDTTSFHRVQLWKAGLNMFIDHPLTGVGMYNFGVAFSRNYRFENDVDIEWAPHNIFIQALSESGIIGFLSLLLIIIYIFRRNKETRRIGVRIENDGNWIRNFADALDFSLIGFMISGSFLTVLYYPHLYIIIILTLSLNHIARRIQIANEDQIEQIKSPDGLNYHR